MNFFTLGLGTMLLAGCTGSFITSGTGGAGGATSGSSGSTSSGSTTSSGSGTTSSSTSSTSSTSSASSSGGGCNQTTCSVQPGFSCCNGQCVNTDNDIDNCGTCGKTCGGAHPFCNKGTCQEPPCQGVACTANQFCCGTSCCADDQLCCDVPGPVVGTGPTCTAPDPLTGSCPKGCTGCVCASPDTPIATPLGDRPISELRAGDLVYSVDHDAIVAVPVLRTNRAPVHDHHVVRVRLASGAVLEISPRHPTADGRAFGDLRSGGTLDRVGITSAELVPYAHPFTYDILPASDTHTYFAGGALIGTTMPF